MRVVFALGGSDLGQSGIGRFVACILPRLGPLLEERGDCLVVLGTRAELDLYSPLCPLALTAETLASTTTPALNALWHLSMAGSKAADLGGSVLVLPAANRRMSHYSPIPTVAVVHDLAQFHVTGKFDALRMAYVRQILTRSLRTATQLCAVSQTTRDDMGEFLRVSADRVRIVPNGVDAERFEAKAAHQAQSWGELASLGLFAPYVVYVARLEHPAKNHLRLLRAYKASGLPDTHRLVLVGADWGAGAAIDAEVERLGLGSRVSRVGYVDEDKLTSLVACASAVLMVGLFEGFGLPALEALAAGRPVVAARSGALPEIVADLGVYCDPNSENSIAGALSRAGTEEVVRRRAENEGPIRARSFGWNRTAEALVSAIDSAMEQHKSRRFAA